MGGEHETEIAQLAGRWVLQNSFDEYNRTRHRKDRYHYGVFYCSQAMYQLGGECWETFYPGMSKTLTEHQRANGSWEPEGTRDTAFGNVDTSALMVLALTPPYQILPIYQR
mgnify:CR=1 FL=1